MENKTSRCESRTLPIQFAQCRQRRLMTEQRVCRMPQATPNCLFKKWFSEASVSEMNPIDPGLAAAREQTERHPSIEQREVHSIPAFDVITARGPQRIFNVRRRHRDLHFRCDV